jgi:hypothetical protein
VSYSVVKLVKEKEKNTYDVELLRRRIKGKDREE